jgi:DNA-directed RNA polymerase specialized sigma24 family protein
VFVLNREQQEILLPMIFGSASPPHQIFIFIFNKLFGWTIPQLRKQIFANTLDTLATRVEIECADKFEIPMKPLLDVLKQRLRSSLDEEIKSGKVRQIYSGLLDRTVGETALNHYEADEPARSYFTDWWNNVKTLEIEELYLVGQAQFKDEAAFAALRSRHEKRLAGYIRPRVNNDANVEDAAQEVWFDVSQHIHNYDPIHGNFESFVLNRAKYKVLQLNDRNRQSIGHLILAASHQGNESESDIVNLIDSLTAAPLSEAADRMIQRLLYQQLVKRVFSGANPPHQVIVFGFCKLLELRPKEIVAELSDTPLRDLATTLERDYCERAQVYRSEVKSSFGPLHARMALKVDEVLKDSRTSATRLTLHNQSVGDTVLRNYYGDDPEGDITSWWDTVRRRVRNELITKK